MREIANESKPPRYSDKCWRFLSMFIDYFITVGFFLLACSYFCLGFVFRIESRSDRQEDILSVANVGK